MTAVQFALGLAAWTAASFAVAPIVGRLLARTAAHYPPALSSPPGGAGDPPPAGKPPALPPARQEARPGGTESGAEGAVRAPGPALPPNHPAEEA